MDPVPACAVPARPTRLSTCWPLVGEMKLMNGAAPARSTTQKRESASSSVPLLNLESLIASDWNLDAARLIEAQKVENRAAV